MRFTVQWQCEEDVKCEEQMDFFFLAYHGLVVEGEPLQLSQSVGGGSELFEDHEGLTPHLHGLHGHDIDDLAELREERIQGALQLCKRKMRSRDQWSVIGRNPIRIRWTRGNPNISVQTVKCPAQSVIRLQGSSLFTFLYTFCSTNKPKNTDVKLTIHSKLIRKKLKLSIIQPKTN